jgi:hypothetical protein
MKITTFENVKARDKVWDVHLGWGEVYLVGLDEYFPVIVVFPDGQTRTYTEGGLYALSDANQTLFWDEVVIDAPVKPMPDLSVDAKVLVWNYGSRTKYCRHFSHFENSKIYVFDKGTSSWTGISKSAWDHWELAE